MRWASHRSAAQRSDFCLYSRQVGLTANRSDCRVRCTGHRSLFESEAHAPKKFDSSLFCCRFNVSTERVNGGEPRVVISLPSSLAGGPSRVRSLMRLDSQLSGEDNHRLVRSASFVYANLFVIVQFLFDSRFPADECNRSLRNRVPFVLLSRR